MDADVLGRAGWHMLMSAASHLLQDGRDETDACKIISDALISVNLERQGPESATSKYWTKWDVWRELRPPGEPDWARPMPIMRGR